MNNTLQLESIRIDQEGAVTLRSTPYHVPRLLRRFKAAWYLLRTGRVPAAQTQLMVMGCDIHPPKGPAIVDQQRHSDL